MSLGRRGFLAMLSALPFIKWLTPKAAPVIAVSMATQPTLTYLSVEDLDDGSQQVVEFSMIDASGSTQEERQASDDVLYYKRGTFFLRNKRVLWKGDKPSWSVAS